MARRRDMVSEESALDSQVCVAALRLGAVDVPFRRNVLAGGGGGREGYLSTRRVHLERVLERRDHLHGDEKGKTWAQAGCSLSKAGGKECGEGWTFFNPVTARSRSSSHSTLRSTLLARWLSCSIMLFMALSRCTNSRCSRNSSAVISFTIPTHSSAACITEVLIRAAILQRCNS